MSTPGRARLIDKLLNVVTQEMPVRLHGFSGHPVDLDQLTVVSIDERTVLVQHESQTARHAGAKVDARGAQHGDQTAGHIFAAVITRTFNHRVGAGVANSESLSGDACGK